MHIPRLTVATFGLLLFAGSIVRAQEHPPMPPGMTHEQHLAQMQKDAELKKRGAAAMGFDQEATTHHFLLTADGGVIDVGVNQSSDATNRDAVRAHLKEIAGEFARGDFAKPFATHGEVPPGVRTMQQRLKAIAFRYEDTERGGRVVIRTEDGKARTAVQDFLRYQIREHATGDPLA
jgi:hypothetical protein